MSESSSFQNSPTKRISVRLEFPYSLSYSTFHHPTDNGADRSIFCFARHPFVYHSAERLDAYPEALIRDVNRTDERVVLTTIDGKTYTCLLSCVDSVSNCPPDSLPRFLSFKFNNKYNDQLFTDV